MPSTGLRGPFTLSNVVIDREVRSTSPGAYALDSGTDANTFYVHYAGRSDIDVNARLKQHVGNYRRFKFEYYSSPKAAFDKECHLYHDFDPRDNSVHPARPSGSGWKCPRCGVFG